MGRMNYKGDTYYIEQIYNGSVNAFACIVEQHKDHIFNLALRICGNREEAEEIAQDSFLKAYKALGGFKMKSTFSTWLYRIAYNTAISHVRSRKKGILSLDEFPAAASDFLSSAADEDEAVEEYKSALVSFALQKIGEEDRALITLYYYEGLDTDRIAEITGISRQNIKVRLFRTRQKLGEIIRNAEEKNLVYDETK
jgi:RNA polymerase sigma factor (sigma-70 family)